MNIELPAPNYRQEKSWSCGPAALKILLDFFGHPVTEDQLIHLTDAKSRGGTEHEGMVQAAEILGHQTFSKENATEQDILRFLQQGVPVIVDYQGNEGGHYVVVSGFKDGRVELTDPRQEGSQKHSLDWNVFVARWFNIRFNNRKIENRWMMAILPV